MCKPSATLFAECGWCGIYNNLGRTDPPPDTSWICGWCDNVFLLVQGAAVTQDELPRAKLCVITEDDTQTIK